MTDRIETHRFPPTMTDKMEVTQAEYGRIHTDGSRSGGLPPIIPGAEMEMSLGFDPDRKPKPPSADLVGVVRKLIAQLGTVQFERDELRDQLAAAIERHEAFAQEVSDAVADVIEELRPTKAALLSRFIIAKPDPLVEALAELGWAYDDNGCKMADELRKAVEARGGKIV